MNPAVVKFGGSSLARMDQLRDAAGRLVSDQHRDRRLVVVVSARGRQTDRLRRLAGVLSSRPPARDLDLLLSSGEQMSAALLSMAVQEAGGRARALTASQAGIVTNGVFGRATVRRVDTARLQDVLASGVLPIVAGFQGVTRSGEVTTLGRGGSDTTAVAVAAALGFSCEIRTDVEGVFSADPAVIRSALLRPIVGYGELVELARFGARVLHWEAALLAQQHSVDLQIRRDRPRTGGTRLTPKPEPSAAPVTAVTTCCWVEVQLRLPSPPSARRLCRLWKPAPIAVQAEDSRWRVAIEEAGLETLLEALPATARLEGKARPVGLLTLVGPAAASSRIAAILSRLSRRHRLRLPLLEVAPDRLTLRCPASRAPHLLALVHEALLEAGVLHGSSKGRADFPAVR